MKTLTRALYVGWYTETENGQKNAKHGVENTTLAT